jgi:hypothetical protein
MLSPCATCCAVGSGAAHPNCAAWKADSHPEFCTLGFDPSIRLNVQWRLCGAQMNKSIKCRQTTAVLVRSTRPYCGGRSLFAKLQSRGRLSISKSELIVRPHGQFGVWASRSAKRLLAPDNCCCSSARRWRASAACRAWRILFGGECRPKRPSFRTLRTRCQRCDAVAYQASRPFFRLHTLHFLLCRIASRGDRRGCRLLPARRC